MENKKLGRRDLLIKIAKMYYIENLSQDEIAKVLDFSRSNISRMLKACVDEKIVEFRINDTSSKGMELQLKIKELYGLLGVIVVPTDDSIDKTKSNVGKAAAAYLESVLENGMLIGISWGTTLYHMVNNFKPAEKINADVIQLTGGMGSSSLDTDGQELARNLAKSLSGQCYLLQTPLVVQSKVLKDMLMEEPHIRKHFSMIAKADIAYIGIGSNIPEFSAVYRSGYISKEESENLVRIGAVADICGHKIDVKGNVCHTDINAKIIAIDTEQLKKIPLVVGAVAGIEKAEAIMAGLRGKYIKVLVIDEETALKVLELENC